MKQPLVVGYKGEIGSFILQGLLRIMPKALNIWCVDINETKEEVIERIKNSVEIFLCVPLESTKSWILKYKSLLKQKIIIEQCSLKEWLYEDERLKDLDLRSMHILFRPSQTPNLEDRKIGLFIKQFDEDMEKDIANITQSKIVWYANSKDHDSEMAIQQALVHRTLLILGKTLNECNGSTYICKKVMELDERIRKGNKNLYKMIQENKHVPKVLQKFKKEFDKFNIEKYW